MFLTKTRAPYHPISIATWTAPAAEVIGDLDNIASEIYTQSQMKVSTYTDWASEIAAQRTEEKQEELFLEPWFMDPEKEAPLLPWLKSEMEYFAEAIALSEPGPEIYICCIPERFSLSYDETNRQHVDKFINYVFDHCAPARAFVILKREGDLDTMSINLTSGYGVFHAYNDVLEKVKKQSPAFLPGGALWPNPEQKHPDIHPPISGGDTTVPDEDTTPDETDPDPAPTPNRKEPPTTGSTPNYADE